MREVQNRSQYESFLHELRVRTFAGDREQLIVLGLENAQGESWSFSDIFAGKNFLAALLVRSFNRGISVPEQYLDEIRSHSPQTRIAVFCDYLSCIQAEV